eukprot:9053943-Pyramimonas_sp.AAC.1
MLKDSSGILRDQSGVPQEFRSKPEVSSRIHQETLNKNPRESLAGCVGPETELASRCSNGLCRTGS